MNNIMDNKNFIKDFVSERYIEEKRESCLMVALQNARILSRRDKEGNFLSIEVAEKLDELIDFNSFIGLVNYLIILDMIGVVFTNTVEVGKRIDEVLQEFGNINCEKDRQAICSLRNCLAHNYGLVDNKKNIKFILDNSCDVIVKHPVKDWNGSYNTEDESTSTIINPQKLIDKIEAVYEEVKKRVLEGSLTTDFTKNELKSRFTIMCE